jgi:hypothetical protein
MRSASSIDGIAASEAVFVTASGALLLAVANARDAGSAPLVWLTLGGVLFVTLP